MNRKERRLQKRKAKAHRPLEERFAEAVAFFKAGRRSDARKAVDALLVEYPRPPDLYQLRGMIALEADAPSDAEKDFRQGLSVDPANAALTDLLGTTLIRMGRLDESVTVLRRAIEMAPSDPGPHNNLGNALMMSGNLEAAVAAYERSLRLRPGDAKTLENLGNALKRLDRRREAEAAYRKALDATPGDLEILIDLGELVLMDRRWEDALDCLDRAIEQGTWNPDAHVFKAKALMALGRMEEAERAVGAGLRLDPDHPYSRQTLSILHFYAERWLEGWQCFEARWEMPASPPRPFAQPLWKGTPCADKTVLVWGEQGLGDEIMYASMVPDMRRHCAHVVVEADSRLVPIFDRSFAHVECVARTDPPHARTARPDIDYQVPLGNLGTQFRKSEADFPNGGPYLRADAERAEAIRARYAAGQKKTVGLAWFSSRAGSGIDKSMPLMALAPLFDVADIRFVDLQYGDTRSERADLAARTGADLHHDEAIDQMVDLDGFAAQVAAMDLVISISNTTVHLAGALGVPTWLMVNAFPDRRWMLDRPNTLWYGSVRIFRQTHPEDWRPVISRVRDELEAFRAP